MNDSPIHIRRLKLLYCNCIPCTTYIIYLTKGTKNGIFVWLWEYIPIPFTDAGRVYRCTASTSTPDKILQFPKNPWVRISSHDVILDLHSPLDSMYINSYGDGTPTVEQNSVFFQDSNVIYLVDSSVVIQISDGVVIDFLHLIWKSSILLCM